MPRRIAVHGDGVAACTCVSLLRKHGFEVSFNRSEISTGPTLLINPSTQQLLQDVFGNIDELLSECPIIRKRIVLWGKGSEPTVLPHFGVAIQETLLLQRLWGKIEELRPSFPEDADWCIYSTAKGSQRKQQQFGSRVATAVRIQLTGEAESDAVYVESLQAGWLFLLPCGDQQASLLAVGGTLQAFIEQSRLVGPQIECAVGPTAQFVASPRIFENLCAPGWLASGTGAMSFDPICGEGAGNAVREAILASAVIRSIACDSSTSEALSHYSARLMIGFLRHLETCRQFYKSASQGEWWDAELSALERGIDWTQKQLSSMPGPQFRLAGFRLERLPH